YLSGGHETRSDAFIRVKGQSLRYVRRNNPYRRDRFDLFGHSAAPRRSRRRWQWLADVAISQLTIEQRQRNGIERLGRRRLWWIRRRRKRIERWRLWRFRWWWRFRRRRVGRQLVAPV